MPCARCGATIDDSALACPYCRALVFAGHVTALTERAIAAEEQGRFGDARALWLDALYKLPASTTQAAWVAARVRRLRNVDDLAGAGAAPNASDAPASSPAIRWLGPLGPVVIALLKGKGLLGLLKFQSLFGLLVSMRLYWLLFGAQFGIGFVLLILVHEMGHFADVRRRGLPADAPVFLPGLGAYVRWQAMGVTDTTRAMVALAGPLAGTAAAFVCLAVHARTGAPLWAALARAGAWLNALNLAPIALLDGGQAIRVFNRSARLGVLVTAAALFMLGGESVFLLVALAALWSALQRDCPQAAD